MDNYADIRIDRDKTLMRFTMAEIQVRKWCKARGFGKTRFYDVLAGTTLKYRTCRKAMRLVERFRLSAVGALVAGPAARVPKRLFPT